MNSRLVDNALGVRTVNRSVTWSFLSIRCAFLWALAGVAGAAFLVLGGAASASADEATVTPESHPAQLSNAQSSNAEPANSEAVSSSGTSVTDPVDNVAGPLTKPLTDGLAPATDPIVKRVDKALAPATRTVAKPVEKAVRPVSDPIVNAVAKPLEDVNRAVVAPVAKAVADIAAPTTRTLASVVDGVAGVAGSAVAGVGPEQPSYKKAMTPSDASATPASSTTKIRTHASLCISNTSSAVTPTSDDEVESGMPVSNQPDTGGPGTPMPSGASTPTAGAAPALIASVDRATWHLAPPQLLFKASSHDTHHLSQDAALPETSPG